MDVRQLRNSRLLLEQGLRQLPRADAGAAKRPSLMDRLQTASGATTPREARFDVGWDEVGLAQRDATVAGTGGYLVGDKVLDVADAPLHGSLLDRCTVLVGLQGDILIPRTVTSSSGAWIPNEGASITPSDAVLGQVAMAPKVYGVSTGMTRNLVLQGGRVADQFIRRDLVRATHNAIEAAALAGAGSSGEPLGLTNNGDVDSNSGASLDLADVLAAQETVAAFAGARDGEVEWLAAPDVRVLLAARERAAGSGMIWEGSAIGGQRARVSANAPAATLFCGLWSELVIGLWGPGITVEVDPHASFKTGAIAYRVIVVCDVAARQPGAFSILTSVS